MNDNNHYNIISVNIILCNYIINSLNIKIIIQKMLRFKSYI